MTKARCEFVANKEGKFYQCTNECDGGTTRMCSLCSMHYRLLIRDNKKRIAKEIDIPRNTDIIIKLTSVYARPCTEEINKPQDKEEYIDPEYNPEEPIVVEMDEMEELIF